MTADEVVAEISRRAWRFGVAVLLQPTQKINNDGFMVGGYFDEVGRVLAVAVGERPEQVWLGVLLHEYSHLTQWVEDQPSWAAYRSDMWDWLGGKRIHKPAEAMRSVQRVEEDCERRTMRLIRELNAPIDLAQYARAANAYIHFHNVMAETRKWYRDDVVLAEREDVLSLCSATIDKDFSKTPAKLYRALLTCV